MRLYQVEIHLLLSRTVIIKLKASYSKRLFIFPQQLPLNFFFFNLQGWAMSIRWVLNLTSRLNKHWFENSILGPATQLPEIMPSTHSRYNFNSITIIHPFWWLFFYLRSLSVTLLPESTSTCCFLKESGSLLWGWKFTWSHLPISTVQV